jgi:hypothetical protein
MKKSLTLIAALALLNACASHPPKANVAAQSRAQTDAPVASNDSGGTFSVYGNWCGPDHPKDENMAMAPGPIDKLDAACMIHDYCYAEVAYLDCGCDRNLTNALQKELATGGYDRRQTVVARAMYDYFAASPCDDSSGTAYAKPAPSRALYRVYDGAKQRINGLINRFSGDKKTDKE